MNTTTTIEIGGLLYMMFCLQAYRPAECFPFDALFLCFQYRLIKYIIQTYKNRNASYLPAFVYISLNEHVFISTPCNCKEDGISEIAIKIKK